MQYMKKIVTFFYISIWFMGIPLCAYFDLALYHLMEKKNYEAMRAFHRKQEWDHLPSTKDNSPVNLNQKKLIPLPKPKKQIQTQQKPIAPIEYCKILCNITISDTDYCSYIRISTDKSFSIKEQIVNAILNDPIITDYSVDNISLTHNNINLNNYDDKKLFDTCKNNKDTPLYISIKPCTTKIINGIGITYSNQTQQVRVIVHAIPRDNILNSIKTAVYQGMPENYKRMYKNSENIQLIYNNQPLHNVSDEEMKTILKTERNFPIEQKK